MPKAKNSVAAAGTPSNGTSEPAPVVQTLPTETSFRNQLSPSSKKNTETLKLDDHSTIASSVKLQHKFPDSSVREEISDLSAASLDVPTPKSHHILNSTPIKITTSSVEKEFQSTPMKENTSKSLTTSISPAKRSNEPMQIEHLNDKNDFSDLKRVIEPVTSQELQEVYQLLRFDSYCLCIYLYIMLNRCFL